MSRSGGRPGGYLVCSSTGARHRLSGPDGSSRWGRDQGAQHNKGRQGVKVLIISYHHADPNSVGSLRTRALAKYLPRFGIGVSVLTRGEGPAPISCRDDVIEVSTRDLNRYKPDAWLAQSMRFSAEIRSRVNPDLVIASYSPVQALQAGVALSASFGVPLISDFRDGLLFDALETAANGDNRKSYEDIEATVVERSSMILAVSSPLADYFREKYAHPCVETMSNGFDPDDIEPDDGISLPADVVNISHTGRLDFSRWGTSQNGNGLQALSAALASLSQTRPDVLAKLRLHFVGQLSEGEIAILSPWAEMGIVKLWGAVNRRTALGFQRKSDILLLITVPDVASLATGKIFEYLSASKPILALTRGTEAERILAATGAGASVPPDKPGLIVNALIGIAEGKASVGRRNEKVIATYSWYEQAAAFAKTIARFG
jgi:hypothetical protein